MKITPLSHTTTKKIYFPSSAESKNGTENYTYGTSFYYSKEPSFEGKKIDAVKSLFAHRVFNSDKKNNSKKEQFSYKPVSSLKPDYSPLNCNYRDIDVFCELYCDKLNSQLMQISKNDVEKLISRIQRKTRANKNLIREVLYKLSIYSTYNSFDDIQELINRYCITGFGSKSVNADNKVYDSSFNTILNYLAAQKKQIWFFTDTPGTTSVILDDRFICELEKCKNSKDRDDRAVYDNFINEISTGKLKFFTLPGWDVKCSDGKYRSANMFLGTGYLEDIACDVVSRVQQGEELDNILYSDLSQRLTDLVSEDTNEKIYLTKVPYKKANYTTDDVYKNLKINSFDSDFIKSTVEHYFKPVPKSAMAETLKYVDETTYVFSPDTLALNLQKLHKEINKKIYPASSLLFQHDKNTVYVVPDADKSFSYITNVFAKLNDIREESVLGDMLIEEWSESEHRHKHKVMIDDISASGKTLENYTEDIEYRTKDSKILFATVVSSNSAKNIKKNALSDEKIPSVSVFNFRSLDQIEDQGASGKILDALKCTGYSCISSSCAFPYMIPDSNNDFVSILFSRLLYKNTLEANKGLNLAMSYNAAEYARYLN